MSEPVLTHRLDHGPMWVALGVVVTVAVTGTYAWAWTQSLDRPWFPLMAVATLVVGVALVATFLRRWHTVEVLSEPARLRARGIRRSETFDISGAALAHHDVAVASTMHNVDAALSDRRRTPPVRSELVIDTADRSLVVQARGHRRPTLSSFATQLGQLLDTEVTQSAPVTRRSAVRPSDGGRDTVHLNGDVSTQGAARGAGRWIVMAVWGVALLGVPMALAGPAYEMEVSGSSQRRIAGLSSLLSSNGVELRGDAESVTVSADWRKCRRENAWLWGEGTAASLELVARTPVEASDMAAVAERLDEVLDRRGGEMRPQWHDRRTSHTVKATDDGLELRFRHECLREDQHEQTEAQISERVVAWLSWLASPDRP